MVMFHKNGQGYFDFDLNELEKRTSTEFMLEVEWALDRPYVEKVIFEELPSYVCVYVLTNALIQEMTFDKKTNISYSSHVTLNVMRLFEDGGKKYV